MFRIIFTIYWIFAMFGFGFFVASAHPGRTDSSGCHTCRTNCSSWGLSSGEYHCHRAKSAPQPKEPVKSHYGENGTGYTDSAPEYKEPVSNVAAGINYSASTDDKENDSSGFWKGVLVALGIFWLLNKFK